jgi:16S rRNA (adenine1518-N6/adenine1519-N6)-dimethyltransferase
MKWSKTRALGQHHLADKRILRKILDSARIGRKQVVCEAGTGEGTLTQELCKHAKKVISYEIDSVLYMRALNYLSGFSNLYLVHSDIFKISNIEFHVFVSNLPYSRSKDAIEWLALRKFRKAVIMLQKEFVDKLQAKPGEPNYRLISVIGQYCFRIDILFDVSRTSFLPQPQVDSQVIRLTPYIERRIDTQTLNVLNYFFSQRNKKVSSFAKAIGAHPSSYYKWDSKRIDQLDPQELIALSESFKNVVSK